MVGKRPRLWRGAPESADVVPDDAEMAGECVELIVPHLEWELSALNEDNGCALPARLVVEARAIHLRPTGRRPGWLSVERARKREKDCNGELTDHHVRVPLYFKARSIQYLKAS